jgi:hypothetical protein
MITKLIFTSKKYYYPGIKFSFVFFLFGFFIPISNAITHTYSYGFFTLALVIHTIFRIRINKNILLIQLIAYTLILLQTFLTSGWNQKALLSGMILIYCAGIFYSFGMLIASQSKLNFKRSVSSIFFLITFLALISFTLSNYFGYNFIYSSAKPIFPFEEPSHFALYICPFLFTLLSSPRLRDKLIIFLFLFTLSFYFQSLIFGIFAFLSLLLGIKILSFAKIFFILSLALISFFFIDYVFLGQYMFLRLSSFFSPNIINMSALVYLQGWESIRQTLIATPFGIGFQFLGYEPPNLYSLYIKDLSGDYVNRQDGGFLLAKLFSEFGLFLVPIFLYFFYWIKVSYEKTLLIGRINIGPVFYLFISLIVPLLFRDVGYFSYTLFYFFTSCGYLYASTCKIKDPRKMKKVTS